MQQAECFRTEPVTKQEHVALQALERGEASPGQQTLALSCIIKKLSRAYDVAFVPSAQDQSDFLSGRGFVGQRIMYWLKRPVGNRPEDQDVQDQA